MKPKYITTLIFLSTLLFFGGCTEDERSVVGPGIPIPEGYSQMKILFSNTAMPRTYAPEKIAAYPQEKEIRSVAFFTQCGDEGTPGQAGFKAGAFNKYFSTEDLRSVNGLYEPLEKTGDNYTTTLRVKSDSFEGETKVMVIVNYVENGLADVLHNIEQWEQLDGVRTPEITTDNLHTPLLMYGYKEVDLKSQQTTDASFSMYRVVSRIDVINEAYNDAEPEKGFVLESAQLLDVRKYSFLKPENVRRTNIATVATLPAIEAGNLPEGDINKVVGMYMYETDNVGVDAPATRLVIKGKLFDTPFEREIKLKQPDEIGKDGDPIALERNTLYRVRITKFEGEDVEWDVQVIDWSSTTPIPVPPTYAVPELTDFAFEGDGATRWTEATKTYTYDGKQAEKIRFKASGLHHTIYNFKCELDTTGRSLGLNFSNSENYRNLVKRENATLKDNVVEQEYEITLPAVVNSTEAVPTYIKVFIRNSGDPHYVDSITVRCIPDYLGIPDMKPVLVGGKYWAPLNVGATKIEANAAPSLEAYGYYYQWGRNLAFHPTAGITDLAGPASYYNATEGTHKDVFISSVASGWEWLLASDTEGKKIRDNLWSKGVNDNPCPKGWRVPTLTEATVVTTKSPTKTNKYMVIKGDETGKDLYLPLAGYAHPGTKVYTTQGSNAYYWAMPVPPSTSNAFHYSSSPTTSLQGPAHGFPLRCIQNSDE
ncbi:hypothetical protein LJC57_09870 [Parabacteroides sp. OttesenSCG-928-G07]|nr:hypothetical protein [Parabacteroides sp. OttesenSCG-928-G07]